MRRIVACIRAVGRVLRDRVINTSFCRGIGITLISLTVYAVSCVICGLFLHWVITYEPVVEVVWSMMLGLPIGFREPEHDICPLYASISETSGCAFPGLWAYCFDSLTQVQTEIRIPVYNSSTSVTIIFISSAC